MARVIPKPPSDLTKVKADSSFFSRFIGAVAGYLDQDPNTNIVEAILRDHKDLKDLLKILKDSDETVERKKTAFKLFSSLLKSHSDAEEKALYALSATLHGTELKTAEGFVEHDVALDLLEKIKSPQIKGRDRHWRAQVQVLGELVEHHLKEEERDLLPRVRREFGEKLLEKSSKLFLKLRKSSQKTKNSRNAGALK